MTTDPRAEPPVGRSVKLFKNGRSPAVRLPSHWVSGHDRALLTRVGRSTIVVTLLDDDTDPLATLLDDLADNPVPVQEWEGFEPDSFLQPEDVDL